MTLEKAVEESTSLVDLESKLDKIIRNQKTKTYFFEASIAKNLLDKIKKEKARGKKSIKFIAYPNNAGVEICSDNSIDDEEVFKKRFGWKFYSLG